jgi:hypothetical protein
VKEHLERLLPELDRPRNQREIRDLLKDRGVSSSRQSVSVAVASLVEEGVMRRVLAPTGSVAPHLYGPPNMFGGDGANEERKEEDEQE